MLLMLDKYDSFVYNLVRYFEEIGEQVEVVRNDKINMHMILSMRVKNLGIYLLK